MFINEITYKNKTYTSFGSIENYHPIVKQYLKNNDSYEVGSVWISFLDINEDSIHACQIAIMDEN